MNEVTVNLFFDERREKKNKFSHEKKEKIYPVKVTVYHPILGKRRYKTGADLTSEQWEKINAPKLKDPDLKETKLKLDAIVLKADDVIKKLPNFSFADFETEFLGELKKKKKDSFFEIFRDYTKQIKSIGQDGLAASYERTFQLLLKFRSNLFLSQITSNLLAEFEIFLTQTFDDNNEKKEQLNLIVRSHMRNIKSVILDLIAKGKLLQDKSPFNILFELFQIYREDLKAEDRVGTEALFRYTCNTLKEMRSNLQLLHVTEDFLKEYENFLQTKKISSTTIGINFRNLRAIINVAIKKGLFPKDQYPFEGFVIPSSQNVKKALDDKSLKKLLKYTTKDPDKSEAWDYWVFLYLGNGLNMKDAALLLKERIDKYFFYFNRAKTIRTRKKDLRPIKVPIHPLAKKIIDRRKSDDSNPYLFPILKPGLGAVTIRGRINRKLKFVNKHIKEIFKELNIELGLNRKPGTMDARHSFATKLRRKGVPDNEIGEYLGHADPKTTKNYFDSFPDEHLKKRSKLLL